MVIALNKYEWLDYNYYAKMNEEQLDKAETELNNICCNYNNCGICPLHKRTYTNVNCKIDLCSLASKDNVEIEVLDNDK